MEEDEQPEMTILHDKRKAEESAKEPVRPGKRESSTSTNPPPPLSDSEDESVDWDDPDGEIQDTSEPTASYSKTKTGVGKTLISNVGRDDDTRCLKRNERTYTTTSRTKSKRNCSEEETSELSISGDLHPDSNQGVCSELRDEVASNLSKSVVSLVVSDEEHTVLFRCSGVAVDRVEHATRILTSASLVKALNDKRKDHENLKVEVRHEDNAARGFLGEYDLHLNIAAVNIENFPDLQALLFKDMPNEISLPNEVVAAGRDIYGKLVATSGKSNIDSSISVYHEELMFSTCKISEVCEGGPLFDYDGDFVGINLSFDTEGTYFLPMLRVLGWLGRCTSLQQFTFPALSSSMAARVGEKLTVRDKYKFGDLESLGYPEPPASMLNDGVLVYSFEEPFGDIWGKGVWSELSAAVASNIHENIVALASFSGGKRFFSCSGVFIEWNGRTTILTSANLVRITGDSDKIVENLKIQVLFHDKQRAEGELLHYSARYNVALVSVKEEDHCVSSQPVKIQQHSQRRSGEVLAVGYSFISGSLMAARGRRSTMKVAPVCEYLSCSTCRVTKAGIGGPLVDFDGDFIGMNFYDAVEGTPYLPSFSILEVLEHFMTKRTVAEGGYVFHASRDNYVWKIPGDMRGGTYRWHVPQPFWCHLDDLDKHEDEIRIAIIRSGRINSLNPPSYVKIVHSVPPFLLRNRLSIEE